MNEQLEKATKELGWSIRWFFTSWRMRNTKRNQTYDEWRDHLGEHWTFKQAYDSYKKQNGDRFAQAFVKDMTEAINYLFSQWFNTTLSDEQVKLLKDLLR
jgi:hypothetical protein